jgi:hypothetical protein
MNSVPVNKTTFPDPDFGVPKSFGILYSSPTLNNGNPLRWLARKTLICV